MLRLCRTAIGPRVSHRSFTRRAATMGFEKSVLKEGNGPKPAVGQTVTVHCTGCAARRMLRLR